MNDFTVHTIESAAEPASGMLEKAKSAYGFLPNLLGVFAESPTTLGAYLQLGQSFEASSFSTLERHVVLLAVNRFNECRYCMAAHSVIANMQDVPADIIEALRTDQPIEDDKLETLRKFTTLAVEKRGWVTERDVFEFTDAGYSRAQLLEVILAISFKTLSNYVNHIADTPLDEAFAGSSWQPRS